MVHGSAATRDADFVRSVLARTAVTARGTGDSIFRLCALATRLAPGRSPATGSELLEAATRQRSNVARVGYKSTKAVAAQNIECALRGVVLRKTFSIAARV